MHGWAFNWVWSRIFPPKVKVLNLQIQISHTFHATSKAKNQVHICIRKNKFFNIYCRKETNWEMMTSTSSWLTWSVPPTSWRRSACQAFSSWISLLCVTSLSTASPQSWSSCTHIQVISANISFLPLLSSLSSRRWSGFSELNRLPSDPVISTMRYIPSLLFSSLLHLCILLSDFHCKTDPPLHSLTSSVP